MSCKSPSGLDKPTRRDLNETVEVNKMRHISVMIMTFLRSTYSFQRVFAWNG